MFDQFLPETNEVFIIHGDNRTLLPLYIDLCTTVDGAIRLNEAYHTEFWAQILHDNHPICHLEALNAVATLTTWALSLRGKLVHILRDNAM